VGDRQAGDGPGAELPGLVASPAVAELLAHLESADRANACATALLADLFASGDCESTTGVAVETWLLTSGVPTTDRRMLATAAVQLCRLPSVRDGFDRRLVTWGQVRTLCLLAAPLSDEHAAALDLALARPIVDLAGADPDGLLSIARQVVDGLRAERVADEAETVERGAFVSFQPRMDGTGAKVYGDLDGLGYGLVAAALDVGAPLPRRRRDLIGQPNDPVRAIDSVRRLGRWRADRLVQLCADELARAGQPLEPHQPLAADAPDTVPSAGGAPAPASTARSPGVGEVDRTRALAPEALLLLTVDQLTGADPLPVELVSKVTGGRLKVASTTARTWLAEAGARLRAIVLDETGAALGVGHRTRVPPGWMRDVQLALHAHCGAPGCRTAAAACDVDHHQPVVPVRDGDRPGRTDLDNLGPLCRPDNIDKERQGWLVDQRPDGTIRWRHPRSGLQVRTVPDTVRRATAARGLRTADPPPGRAGPAGDPADGRPADGRPDRAPPDAGGQVTRREQRGAGARGAPAPRGGPSDGQAPPF
jgi:hypothetical protein